MKPLHLIIGLMLTIILVLSLACSPLAQPQQQPQTTPTQPTWIEVTAEAVINVDLVDLEKNTQFTSPVVAEVTNTPIPSPTLEPTEVLAIPTFTPTPTENMPTATSNPDSIIPTPTIFTNLPPISTITESLTELTQTGNEQLTLSIVLDKTKLLPPVREIIYKTTELTDYARRELTTQFWRTNVSSVNQATPIFTLTHHTRETLSDIILSPNGKFIVFGQFYSKNPALMQAWLFNIDSASVTAIDKKVIPYINRYSFIWSNDSQSLIYTKMLNDTSTSSLNQYQLTKKQTTLLFETDKTLNLVTWQHPLIYYIPTNYQNDLHIDTLQTYNLETKQFKNVTSIQTEWGVTSIKQSPNKKLALLDGTIIDLEAKIPIATLPFNTVLWFPDSQGLLSLYSKPTDILKSASFGNQPTQPLTTTINLPVHDLRLMAWSPDGEYLIYYDKEDELCYMLNTITNQLQTFNASSMINIIGWVN